MNEILAIIFGLFSGFISLGIQSLFISKRDQYHNANFTTFLWKLSLWIGGFIIGAGLFYRWLQS
jgi:uncharacterized membrane protein